MRILSASEMNLVAGGSDPKMVCVADPVTVARSGNTTVTTSGSTCQTSSGLTIIKSTETTAFSAEVGLSGLAKRVIEGHVEGDWVNTKQTTTTCDSKNDCKTVIKESNPQRQSGDASDGSNAQNLAFDQLGDDLGNFDAFAGGGNYGGGDSAGCVQIASRLPCGTLAGDIVVGSEMQLSDQASLMAGVGIVSFSKRKKAPGYRLTTVSGITLVCSNTAPIPTTDGIVLAPNVLGKSVAIRRDEGGVSHSAWEPVASVFAVGEIEVQHITVGDKCFWAGEKPNSYILHHNMKNADYSSGGYDSEINWDDWC